MSQRQKSMEFFAAIEDPIKLADEMMTKIRVWREFCATKGIMTMWRRKLKNYYGISDTGNSSQAVISGGSEGELSLIKINDLRNLIQNQLVIVTGERPAGIAKAAKLGTQALRASKIGTALAEYYMSRPDAGFEKRFVQGMECALLLDEAYFELYWDKTLGKIVASDPYSESMEMDMEKEGDLILRVHPPYNVARDPGCILNDQRWHIISLRCNRFNSAATYPRFENAILSAEKDDLPDVPMNFIPDGSDSIWGHLLVADKSPACPDGRYALMLGGKVVMDLKKLPFKCYPIEPIIPDEVIDGPMGYSNSNDIMAMEEVTDALNSVVVTNQTTFGGQCLVGPDGNNIKQSDFGKGVRFFELPPDMVDKLKSLDMLHTPPEIFNYIKMLDDKKAQMVGVNSVVRGNPEGQLSGASGTALALIQAQAISFNSGGQRSYFTALSNTMTKALQILEQYADTERLGEICGKLKLPGIKQFKYSGQDLSDVACVVYEPINPLFQTIGGRLEFAKDLLREGQIKSPKQYINLALTGQLEVLTQDDEQDGLLIDEENEALLEGRPVHAVITEMHADHIKSHNSQITQESKEKDPKFVSRVQGHVQEHINLWFKASAMNPAILLATGQQVLPVGQIPPPPQIGAPEQPGAGQPDDVGQLAGPEEPAAETKARQIPMPDIPNIAGTDQKPVIPGVTQ